MKSAMKVGILIAMSLAGSSMAAATTPATTTTPAAKSSAMASSTMTPAAKTMEKAKISEARASEIALRQVDKGTITRTSLAKENGRLVYDFNVKRPNQPGIENVVIDANTGKLVSVKHMKA